jgi:hypothetical protein
VLVKASGVNYDTTWATITGTLVYQGSWNAATNTPTLTSSVGTNGYYYVVGTSGSTNLNGITDWVVGDWAIFNGTIWQKIDNTDLVSSVNGQTGVVVLTASSVGALAIANNLSDLANTTTARTNLGLGSIATQNANAVAITGGTIDNTVIGGTTPAAGTFTTLVSTGNITYLGGAIGSDVFRVYKNNTITGGTATETSPAFSFFPKQSNFGASVIGLGENPRVGTIGTDGIYFTTSSALGFAGSTQAKIAHTASAVNYVQVTGAATNGRPSISAQGSDTNVGLNLSAKGNRAILFYGRDFGGIQFGTGVISSAVNYFLASGAITGNSPTLQADGSDTNISQVFQSKGTGAIDLAAGSSGVNISNGGTVTALTLTVNGSLYNPSGPSVSITAPTTAGGVQATASVTNMNTSGTPTVVSGGTGYTNGDTLTIAGTSATLTVTGVSGGVITSVASGNFIPVSLASIPANPASVTGGTGSGATFTILWKPLALTITNAGSGYVEQPTVTFSGGGGSGAAAYATVGSGTIIRGLGTNLDFYTPSGTALTIADVGVPTVNRIQITGNAASGNPAIRAIGSTNVNLLFSSNGTGYNSFYTSGFSTEQLRVTHTASAVNYVQVTGNATGGDSTISAQGSDANTGLIFLTKGSTGLTFRTRGGGTPRNAFVMVDNGASSVNYLTSSSNVASSAPSLSATGSDTNIPLVLQPKGTGALQAQQTDSTATGGNARGANAVDWQTTRASASQVASATASNISGGANNTNSGTYSFVGSGFQNRSLANGAGVVTGASNTASQQYALVGAGVSNTASGWFNFIGNGFTNSGTSASAVTTQSGTMNATTAVTLSGSNANIKVGQYITGTSIAADTYVAAISGTSLTLSQAASGSSTSTLSFFTPHGVVVGGGNNQATGAYSVILGGGDAGTAANRNVASGDWSFVGGGRSNTASGIGSFVGGGGLFAGLSYPNTASGNGAVVGGGFSNTASGQSSFIGCGFANTANSLHSAVVGGSYGTTRSIWANQVFSACVNPIASAAGVSQAALIVLGRQTTDATATVLTNDTNAAGTTNQVILPNNSAYYFKGSVIANVTGAANGASWSFEGAIMRGANAASTVLMGTPAINRVAATAGATAWVIALTADTTNGGLAVTVTGAASTTIRFVAKIETTEVTF